jgi:hypothetical protein
MYSSTNYKGVGERPLSGQIGAWLGFSASCIHKSACQYPAPKTRDGRPFPDPRGCRVSFLDTDFVHLIKLTDKYSKEPKNRRMTIEQIQSGRIMLNPGRIELRRAQELSWARSIIESPTMIVPNWQAMGRAIPGDACIKNFGTESQPIYRVLICGHAGKKRWAVTIFPRERFADREIATIIWP